MQEHTVPVPGAKLRTCTRWMAMIGICAITLAATCIAFVESYDGLREWAAHHLLSGTWAWIWPVQVDAFILIGELSLYVAVLERWPRRRLYLGWTVTLLGGAVSVLGNIGHVGGGHSAQVYGTAAVPPIAATAGLAIGLQVLKWALNLVRPKVSVRVHLVYWSPGRTFRVSPLHWSLARPPAASQPTGPPPAPVRLRPAATSASAASSVTPIRVTERVQAAGPAGPVGSGSADYQRRYEQGMQLYLASKVAGNPLSQVRLARELGQTNRKLAARIIRDAESGEQQERGVS